MPTQILDPDVPTPGVQKKWFLNATGFSVWSKEAALWLDSTAMQGFVRVGVVGHLFGEIIGPLRSGEPEFQICG